MIDAHPDGDQEHPERKAFERRGQRLDFLRIVRFGYQKAGEQRAHNRRKAHGGRGERGGDDDQQAEGEEQFRAFGARRAGEQARQQEPART